MATLNDNLKKTIDDLDLDRRLQQLGEFAQKTVADVKAQAGTLAHDKRDKVDELLARATDALDQRTNGKYHDKAIKFSAAVGGVVDKVADQRPAAPESGDGWPAQPSPTETASAFPAHPYGEATADTPDATGWLHPEAESASTADGTDGQSKAWYAE